MYIDSKANLISKTWISFEVEKLLTIKMPYVPFDTIEYSKQWEK